MKETKSIGIRYGIMADSIAKQLREQGFKFDKEEAKRWEKIRDSINILRFDDILPDSTVDKALAKLHSRIVNSVAKANGKKVKK